MSTTSKLFGNIEIFSDTLFDYRPYPREGAQQFRFFEKPVGTDEPLKTQQDTNMFLSSKLPAGVQFLVKRIEVDLLTSDQEFARRFYATGYLMFEIFNKTYVTQAPLVRFHPRQTMFKPLAHGQGFELEEGILLPSHMPFAVTVNMGTPVLYQGDESVRIGVCLVGKRMRPVQ